MFAALIVEPAKATGSMRSPLSVCMDGCMDVCNELISETAPTIFLKLGMKFHITELCKKLGRTVGMLFKIRHQCNKNVLCLLYFSLSESHLSFGLPVLRSAKSH